MHYAIAAIVYAKDKEKAVEAAEKIFSRLSCEDCATPFDYYEIRPLPDRPVVCIASSKDGQEIIAECMRHTKAWFLHTLRELRAALAEKDDEAVYLQRGYDVMKDVRFLAYGVGRYRGPDIYLYDADGEGIREPGHLKDALEKWPNLGDKETRDKLDSAGDVWVVTADAHS